MSHSSYFSPSQKYTFLLQTSLAGAQRRWRGGALFIPDLGGDSGHPGLHPPPGRGGRGRGGGGKPPDSWAQAGLPAHSGGLLSHPLCPLGKAGLGQAVLSGDLGKGAREATGRSGKGRFHPPLSLHISINEYKIATYSRSNNTFCTSSERQGCRGLFMV